MRDLEGKYRQKNKILDVDAWIDIKTI